MRTDDEGFKLQPGVADGLGIGIDRFAADYSVDDANSVGGLTGVSQSGGERNHLFLNLGDGQFQDISGVAGVDSPEDGRSFAILDYDRDGWQDLVVVNSNAPTTLLYHNRTGALEGPASRNRAIAFRFVGANHGSVPDRGRSPRDGYGAVLEVGLEGSTLLREYRCGEGLSAQNSTTVLVGIGAREEADRVRVRWPGGARHEIPRVPAGSLVTVYEDAGQSPTGEPFVRELYAPADEVTGRSSGSAGSRLSLTDLPDASEPPALRLFTTMATWCASCRGELPDLEHLRRSFAPSELGMYGVPVDEEDTAEELEAYVEETRPAYRMLADLPRPDVELLRQLSVRGTYLDDALPATVVTDAGGEVLWTQLGAPSVSRIRALLREQGR